MNPYLGQIEAFPFNFAPQGWALCAGQMLPISQNQALFALVGTQYGGDGVNNFALPNLQSRISIGFGNGAGLTPRSMGQTGGEEQHILVLTEVPGPHTHSVTAVVNGTTGGSNVPGSGMSLASGYSAESGSPAANIYGSGGTPVPMGTLGSTGGQPHENRMPTLALSYCIALSGIFPSRN